MASQANYIHFKDVRQILNMGGPWIGTLCKDERVITDNAIVDNIVFDDEDSRVYYIKYHLVSKWAKDNFFTINFYDLTHHHEYEFTRKFDMLYLGSINNKVLEAYDAFHKEFQKTKFYFDTTSEPKS